MGLGTLVETTQQSVLVADDDEALQESLGELLAARGFRVLKARTAERARELLAKERPAAMLITQRLPDGPGVEVVEALRRKGDALPVLFTTAPYSEQHIPIHARLESAGVAQSMEKPVDPVTLANQLELMVRGSVGARGSPARTSSSRALPASSMASTLGYPEGRVPRTTRPLNELIGSVPPDGLGDPADPLVGTTVGSFRIIRRVGQGGMGSVYLAQHPAIGSRVAVKFIHESAAANPEAVRRFFAEARVTNMVGHESIVNIIDLAEVRGRFYIVMEFLDGITLGAAIKQGPLAVSDAVRIVRDLCEALQAAHSQGIVHRDLKPDNVFLVPRTGRPPLVKIVDFGIAKLREDHAGDATAPGELMGTPRYMSPEQCDGKLVDGRSDQYALGLIAYELLTGAPAVNGSTMMAIIRSHTELTPTPPHVIRPDVGPLVSKVVMRALAKKPDDRFTDLTDMSGALQDAMEGIGAQVALETRANVPVVEVEIPVKAGRGRTVMAMVMAAAVVAGFAVVAMTGGTVNTPPEAAPPPPAPPPPAPVVTPEEPKVVEPVRAPEPVQPEPKAPAPEVTARKEKVRAPLAMGSVSLQSKPWARVIVDGKDTGKFTPLANLALSAGTHEITLVNDKVQKRATFKVTVRAGQKLMESRTLE